jgi:hypothetical protein
MDTKYLVVAVVAMAVMLIGSIVLGTEDAFAGKKKDYNQATSQANTCGNGELPFNVGCQNTDRQLQGDDNSCTSNLSTANQVFPDERDNRENQALQTPGEPEIPGESEDGIIRNPFGPSNTDPFAPLPPC